MTLIEDQQVVKTLTTQGADEALTNRIEIRSMRRDCELLNASAGSYQRKTCPIFAVIVVHQILRSNTEGSGFSQLLGNPLIRR